MKRVFILLMACIVFFLNESIHAQIETLNDNNIADSILIYSISDEVFNLPKTEIPYYFRGTITFESEQAFKQVAEGHQPWKADPLMTVLIPCSNLVPKSLTTDLTEGSEADGIFTNKDGVIVKKVSPNEQPVKTMEMSVPHLGKYDITVKTPKGTEIFFVTKIIFTPLKS